VKSRAGPRPESNATPPARPFETMQADGDLVTPRRQARDRILPFSSVCVFQRVPAIRSEPAPASGARSRGCLAHAEIVVGRLPARLWPAAGQSERPTFIHCLIPSWTALVWSIHPLMAIASPRSIFLPKIGITAGQEMIQQLVRFPADTTNKGTPAARSVHFQCLHRPASALDKSSTGLRSFRICFASRSAPRSAGGHRRRRRWSWEPRRASVSAEKFRQPSIA